MCAIGKVSFSFCLPPSLSSTKNSKAWFVAVYVRNVVKLSSVQALGYIPARMLPQSLWNNLNGHLCLL